MTDSSNLPSTRPILSVASSLVLSSGIVLACHLLGRLHPGYHLWSLSVWSSLPGVYSFVAAISVGLLLVPAIADRCYALAASVRARLRPLGALGAWGQSVVLLALLTLLVFILHSRALIFGDGFIAVAAAQLPLDKIFVDTHSFLRPLSIILCKASYEIFSRLLGLSATTAFAIYSSIGGALGWLGLARLCRSLERRSAGRAFLFATVCTSGFVLLWVGHMELYVWGAAALIWFLTECLLAVKQRVTRALGMWGVLTVLFNVMLVPIVAAGAIIVWILRRNAARRSTFGATPGRLVTAVAVCSLAMAAFLQFILKVYGTVPIVTQPDNSYTIFSAGHLLALGNIILFSAPMGILLLVTLWRPSIRTGTFTLLWVAAAVMFLVSFWINTDLGAMRDWDLLCFFGLPMTLAGAVLFTAKASETDLRRGAVAMTGVALFLMAPAVYEQMHPDSALARVNPVVWQDPHYQTSYQKAYRCISWAARLHEDLGRTDLAKAYFQRRLQAEPTCGITNYNLGIIYAQEKRFDSAEIYLQQACRTFPDAPSYRHALVNLLTLQKKWADAADAIAASPVHEPADIEALRQCATALLQENQVAEALVDFRRIDSLSPGQWSNKVYVAMTFAALGQKDSCLNYCGQAEAICQSADKCRLYKMLEEDFLEFNWTVEANLYAAKYRSSCTNATVK